MVTGNNRIWLLDLLENLRSVKSVIYFNKHKMEKSEKNGKIVGALLLGAVIGGAIGAALGILFAPEKGSDLRKRLSATGDDFTGKLKVKFKDFVDEFNKETGAVKGAVTDLVENSAKTQKLN
jgi:gas vesicle protein